MGAIEADLLSLSRHTPTRIQLTNEGRNWKRGCSMTLSYSPFTGSVVVGRHGATMGQSTREGWCSSR